MTAIHSIVARRINALVLLWLGRFDGGRRVDVEHDGQDRHGQFIAPVRFLQQSVTFLLRERLVDRSKEPDFRVVELDHEWSLILSWLFFVNEKMLRVSPASPAHA